MKKRNLFSELKEGFDSLADVRAGKASLPVKDFAAVDEWMRDEIVKAYDAVKADPTRAVSVKAVRDGMTVEIESALTASPGLKDGGKKQPT